MNLKEQINNLHKHPCINSYFQNRNICEFLLTYIKIDYLLQNLDKSNQHPLYEKLIQMEVLSENEVIKELLHIIKFQLSIPNDINFVSQIDSKKINDLEEKVNTLLFNKTESNLSNNLINNLRTFLEEENFIINDKSVIVLNNDKPNILIEYSSTTLINNFYQKVKLHSCCGILYKDVDESIFDIDIQDNNIFIVISSKEFNIDLLKLAIKIIYNLYSVMNDENHDISIDKELFQRLKLEYMYYVNTHLQHVNHIKSSVMALEKLTFTQIDHFFKRTHINSDDKPYNCQLCGSKFISNKTLKCHLKMKHEIQLGKSRKPKSYDTDAEADTEKTDDEINNVITF